MIDLIIRGGVLVQSEGLIRADLAIEDGRITDFAEEIGEPAKEILDARGLHIFPGVVDGHVHFNEPGQAHWEGIASGSKAFAAGGGTLFFDMPLNSLPCTLSATEFDQKLAAMLASSLTDFALWGGLTPINLEQLPELAGRGVIGFKAFMSNSGLPEFPHVDDYSLYEGMKVAAKLGLPVAAHAESDNITGVLSQKMQAAGKTTWRDYVASRPVIAEVEAIGRAIVLARETGCKLHLVHVSSGRGVVQAAEAKAKGIDVSIETCPHYLAFTDEDLERLGAIGKCAPPLREKPQHEALWQEVLKGSVDIIGSDHSPSPPDMKQGDNFFKLWGGISGVQSTLPVLLSEGHQKRGLGLGAIVAMLSENPAKRFGLKHKGRIDIGFDADLTLVNLAQGFTLGLQDLHYRHQQSPYLGQTFKGRVEQTLLRGQTVFKGGSFGEVRGQLVRVGLR
jgi:allantoinase